MGILLVGKQFKEEKFKLFESQNGLCPLCKRELNDDVLSNHLDHDHSLVGNNAGKVRALLCVYCNSLEGQILHKFNSSGLNTKNVNISEWLEELAMYYRKDLSSNNIHPNFVNDLTKKFARSTIPDMDTIANEYGISFLSKTTREKRVPIFKKLLKLFLKGQTK